MRIFRHRHLQIAVTLLAFAMQAVLSLADTHTHGAPRSVVALHADASLSTRAVTYGLCRVAPGKPCPAPVQHDDRNCPLCASLALAGTGLIGVPPRLPVRDVTIAPPAPALVAALALDGETVHFQARAPPRLA